MLAPRCSDGNEVGARMCIRQERNVDGFAACWRRASVRMSVMHVWIVPMRVHDRRVNVCVRMRLVSVPVEVVCMTMVLVVGVSVGVLLLLVRVQMPMTFGHVQPDARGHQHTRGDY